MKECRDLVEKVQRVVWNSGHTNIDLRSIAHLSHKLGNFGL